MQAFEGLSKREQIKLERLIRNEQVQKALTHKKSYRKRPSKEKNSTQAPARKIYKTEIRSANQPSDEASSSLQQNTKRQDSQQESNQTNKIEKKVIENPTHLNCKFPLEGGEADLFNYIMTYSYEEKGKCMEQREDDDEFVESLKATSLQKVRSDQERRSHEQINKKYRQMSGKINQIYDSSYKLFIKEYFAKRN